LTLSVVEVGGTVITAFLIALPRKASAVSFILMRIMDEISSGE